MNWQLGVLVWLRWYFGLHGCILTKVTIPLLSVPLDKSHIGTQESSLLWHPYPILLITEKPWLDGFQTSSCLLLGYYNRSLALQSNKWTNFGMTSQSSNSNPSRSFMSLHRIIRQAQGGHPTTVSWPPGRQARIEWAEQGFKTAWRGSGHDQGISKQESEHKQTICETTAGFFVAVPWQSNDEDPI